MSAIKKIFGGSSKDTMSPDEPMYMGKNNDDDGTYRTHQSGTAHGTAHQVGTAPHHGTVDSAASGLTHNHSATDSTPATSHHSGATTGAAAATGAAGLLSGHHKTNDVPGVDRERQLPVEEGVTGRHEETGSAVRTAGASKGSAFTNPHSLGHSTEKVINDVDPKTATHDHKHLNAVVHENVRHLETEEVLREKEHERHIHHVQHHVQPVLDKQVQEEVHHEQVHPVTKIREVHSNTDKDHHAFASLNQHKNETVHAPTERRIVDLGEKVNETVTHHVHHVTQPVIEREVEDRHRIHTVIPTHHVTHESPIVHASSTHAPLSIADFKAKGGVLDSGITHNEAGILNDGECVREVDGVGEQLAQKLHLKSGTTANEHQGPVHV